MNTLLKFLVPLCCIAVSSAYDINIPGLGTIDVPLSGVETVTCAVYITNFVAQYVTPSAACTGDEFNAGQWNNYKQGFNATGRDFGSSYPACILLDNGSTTQLAYCNYIRAVTTACTCDTTTCITTDVIGQVEKGSVTSVCIGVPTTLCESAQKTMEPLCATAVSAPNLPGATTPYDKTKVHLHCSPEDCPRSSGAVKLTAMVALVTVLASLIVS